jgi:hypothetical protein
VYKVGQTDFYRTGGYSLISLPAKKTMSDDKDIPEGFKAYEEGKHRRYNPLFAVNGGAFAVTKVFAQQKAYVLGNLTLHQLGIGMSLFTVVMVLDIFMFGQKMRRNHLPDAFGWQGKSVLIGIGLLIALGWILVAR